MTLAHCQDCVTMLRWGTGHHYPGHISRLSASQHFLLPWGHPRYCQCSVIYCRLIVETNFGRSFSLLEIID